MAGKKPLATASPVVDSPYMAGQECLVDMVSPLGRGIAAKAVKANIVEVFPNGQLRVRLHEGGKVTSPISSARVVG